MLSKIVIFSVLLVCGFANRRELTQEQLKKLASWEDGKKHMWVESGQIEGDMILQPGQRNGLIDTRYRWTNNEVPYELDPAFNEEEAAAIHEAVKEIANVSCVTVRPRRAGEQNYVYVTGTDTGCWSWVGMLRGRQELNLQRRGCIWHEIIVHEFLHAIGFYHEQSNYNRDDHVTILWENIIRGMEHNFDKFGEDYITTFGQPYDYGSIMHYHETAFTNNGEPTIVPHVNQKH
nr:zinc metalloproteinase nas-13-like [Onthophagus taurus]